MVCTLTVRGGLRIKPWSQASSLLSPGLNMPSFLPRRGSTIPTASRSASNVQRNSSLINPTSRYRFFPPCEHWNVYDTPRVGMAKNDWYEAQEYNCNVCNVVKYQSHRTLLVVQYTSITIKQHVSRQCPLVQVMTMPLFQHPAPPICLRLTTSSLLAPLPILFPIC